MPDRGQTFGGSVGDIAALDYLDYEQLGHPDDDLELQALVWGNVLVVQGGLRWCRATGGDLWIGCEVLGLDKAVLWPYARVLEQRSRNYPQSDQMLGLTLRVIDELQDALDLPMEVDQKLHRLRETLTEHD